MNRAQREANRRTNRLLRESVHTCQNCGMKGAHWVQTGPVTLQDILDGRQDSGFWTCPTLYGTDGRRISESALGQTAAMRKAT